MKTLTLICAAAVITTGALAQSTTTTTTEPISIMKKEGRIWMVKPMNQEETMSNGLRVEASGIVRTTQGKTMFLSNGDCISKSGEIVGLNEKSITSAIIKNGKMWTITLLNEPLQLSNGTIVLPNGNVTQYDGTTIKLTNNEIVNISNNTSAIWQPKNVMALNN